MSTERFRLVGPFEQAGDECWVARRRQSGGDDAAGLYRSTLCLYENGERLTRAHQRVPAKLLRGGAYTHWQNDVFFSATDGSDPNTNGRFYEYDLSLDLKSWDERRLRRSAERWNLHPRVDYFISRGGDLIPPPFFCSIGLTNKCNLRCEICGSQKYLDETGTRRRHMEFETFEAVAETIFPFLSVVELNSQGDPLLYPHIEGVLECIARHGCDVKIQHNGTLLTDRVIDLLLQQHGMIMLSLDAVGGKFNEVRRGGNWSRALPGLERLLRERDPERLAIGVYPTLTARTIGEAINVVDWSCDHGIDTVAFHRYSPIRNSFETAPSDDDYASMKERMRQWCADRNDPLLVQFEGETLNHAEQSARQMKHASAKAQGSIGEFGFPVFPTEDGQGDPVMLCVAPRDYVEIGLDGQIGACCRAQDVILGYATSVENFADVWLGRNYDRLRGSLTRGAAGAFPLPNCESCVKFFAPVAAGNRRAVNYDTLEPGDEDLPLDLRTRDGKISLDRIRKEQGHCHVALVPIGIDASDMELWEDDRPLILAGALHDEIRSLGQGRYDIGARQVYFSASDNSDARYNERSYVLMPLPPVIADDGTITIRANWLRAEDGLCYIALLPEGIDSTDTELWEDGQPLRPAASLHAEIRALGGGRHDIGESAVYFSASDNTDPRFNGRSYRLKPLPHLVAADGSVAIKGNWVSAEQGDCYVAALPPETDACEMELFEDGKRLGPARALHDDIRSLGGGRYAIGSRLIYFSASDSSDVRRNGRRYELKPASSDVAADGAIRIRREWIKKENGYCHIASIPSDLDPRDMELWEDEHRLGPAGQLHDDIRLHGAGRYAISPTALYFSASDNADITEQWRRYALRPKALKPQAIAAQIE